MKSRKAMSVEEHAAAKAGSIPAKKKDASGWLANPNNFNPSLASLNDVTTAQLKKGSKNVTASGRYWMEEEHTKFLEGVQMFGFKNVRMVASHVGTRNATQVRTHTQKYLLRKAEWDQKHNTDAGIAEKISEKQRLDFPEGHLAEGAAADKVREFPAPPGGSHSYLEATSTQEAMARAADRSPLQQAAGVPVAKR